MEKYESNYNMIDWWKKVIFKNYANFNGRARRAEYWYTALFNAILIIPFYLIAIWGLTSNSTTLTVVGSLVYIVVAVSTLIPGLAVSVRRLHDLNKSGWNYLIGLIPFIGGIILLVWFFTDGNRFTNNYGDDPKNPEGPEFDFEQNTISTS
jgi:uncharacterized membrane protein YhaH (DUF805 family)